MTRASLFTVAALCALVVAAAGANGAEKKKRHGKPLTATEIFKRSSPGIVLIDCLDEKGSKTSYGTGFFVSSNGKFVTNVHVVQTCKGLSIRLSNGDIYDAPMMVDADVRKDLAVLRVKAANTPALILGDSDELDVGETVYSIGNPSELQNTLQQGLVSGFRQAAGFKLIQISTPLNPGNSGGPVLDDRGEVVGVAAMKTQGSENLGFAIPISYVKGYLQTTTEIPFATFAAGVAAILAKNAAAVNNSVAKPGSPASTGGNIPIEGAAATPGSQAGPVIPVASDKLDIFLRTKIGVWTQEDAKTVLGKVVSQGPVHWTDKEKDGEGVFLTFDTPGTAFRQVALRFSGVTGKLRNIGFNPVQTVQWSRQLEFMRQKFPGDEYQTNKKADVTEYVFSRSRVVYAVRADGTIATMFDY